MIYEDVIRGVLSGKLFGMVECDIWVLEVWFDYFKYLIMILFEYFLEMSFFFCIMDILFDVIGLYM